MYVQYYSYVLTYVLHSRMIFYLSLDNYVFKYCMNFNF